MQTATVNDRAVTTQSKHPAKATIRTAFQVVLALAIVLPIVVTTLGLSDSTGTLGAVVGGVLATAAGITRVMALPQVEEFLRRFAPFLAAGNSETD